MAQIVTWGSCPVCGDCGEPVVKIEHVINGWTDEPMHKYTCPDCGVHYATPLYDCPDCRPNKEIKLTQTGLAGIEVDSPDAPGAVPSDGGEQVTLVVRRFYDR